MKRFWICTAAVLGMFGAGSATSGAAATHRIEVVPIGGTIDAGMAHMVGRAIREAQADRMQAVVLDVDTFGGLVSAGTQIRDSVLNSPLPVYAYVSERAWSAGALVTLAAEHIAMAPGSSIGAAEPIPKTTKSVSALRGEFESTAARNHRDSRLAGAMVDSSLDAPPYKAPGAILTLTADDALHARIADAVSPSLIAALHGFGVAGTTLVTANYTWAERIARFATNPDVSGLLLAIGFLGLLVEMQTLHGFAGSIGAAALGLFFGTHVYAGFSDVTVIALGIAGIVAIFFELHVLPGHGLAGVLGTGALLISVIFAFGSAYLGVAVEALAIAVLLSVAGLVGLARFYRRNAFMSRLAFAGVQGPDYVAGNYYGELIGRTGFAVSYLRPSGIATIDGQRVDVLSEGEFVSAGSAIRVTRAEGARVFVRPV